MSSLEDRTRELAVAVGEEMHLRAKVDLSNVTCRPEYYGGVGDGVTDDTLAIQAMVDHAGDYGTVNLTQKAWLITQPISLYRGQRVLGNCSLPLTDDAAVGTKAPTIINKTGSYYFTYTPVSSSNDRYTAPIISGIRFWADYGVRFGVEDDLVSYFLADGWVERCVFQPWSALGGIAINLIENYRGGARHNWIKGYATGIRDKSSDIATFENNRTWDCTVHIDLYGPVTTGTQRIITHNDMLQVSSAYVAGQTYLIRSEDSWITITDNYMESSGLDSTLYADALVQARKSPGRPFDHLTFERNRTEFNADQTLKLIDFPNGLPDELYWRKNTSRKGPAALMQSIWPTDPTIWCHQQGQRRIQFLDSRGRAPFNSVDFGVSDGGEYHINVHTGNGTQLGPQTALLVADDQSLAFDYDGSGGTSEYWTAHPDLDKTGTELWDIDVIAKGSVGGITFWVQPRNGNTFVSHYPFILSTTYRAYRIRGVSRTAMRLFFGASGSTAGRIWVRGITIRPAVARRGSSALGTVTLAAGARTTVFVVVTGAQPGDLADFAYVGSLAGLTATCSVDAADNVAIVLENLTGVSVTLAAGTWNASAQPALTPPLSGGWG